MNTSDITTLIDKMDETQASSKSIHLSDLSCPWLYIFDEKNNVIKYVVCMIFGCVCHKY